MKKAVWIHLAIAIFLGAPCRAESESNWVEGPGYRRSALKPAAGGKVGFTLMSPTATGVLFTNELRGDAYLTNAVAHNGSGVALGDVDGDGRVDLYLCNLQGANRLYRNLGEWRFQEMESDALACSGQLSSGATFADVDGDVDLDLLVNGISAGTRLFLNDGKGKFSEMIESGLSRTNSGTTMALADIDADGDLDLYCAHYIDTMYLFNPTTRFGMAKRGNQWVVTKVNDQPTTSPRWANRFEALPDGRVRELPEAHALYRNDGGGKFTAIQNSGAFTDESGKPIPAYRDWGLAAMFRDMNGDGAPDIYVCNDNASPDRIWINNGKGTFRPGPLKMLRHFSRSAMGIDFADIDRDGHDDFIVVDMLAREHSKRMVQLVRDYPDPAAKERLDERPEYNRNSLYFGRADGTFVEAAFMAGVAATDWSWSPTFIDVDLDGFEDLLITNGFEFDVLDQDTRDDLGKPGRRLTPRERELYFQFYRSFRTKNAAFRNRGDGTFEATGEKWGFDQFSVSHGMALGDLDNDGDLDVAVNNLNENASLYRNDASGARIAVRLQGTGGNTEGIGARIQLIAGSVAQSQEMICGGRYLSGDRAARVFAATTNDGNTLEVKWQNGVETIISNALPNHIYVVKEADAKPSRVPAVAHGEPFLKDVTQLLGHNHVDTAFDDSARQPGLPRRLSALGPGLCWSDLDANGWEDLIVPAGKGGKMALLMNEQGQRFRRLEDTTAAPGDQAAVAAWNRKTLVTLSNYEMVSGQNSGLFIYSGTNLTKPQTLDLGAASPGPIVVADVDGDGDLDLFVGGRVRPGRYPEPCSSAILINANEQFRAANLGPVGMVTAAVFADLNGDTQLDLALALEWGPIRIFQNSRGTFEEKTSEWGLAGTTGFWMSIAAGDFDGDGRIDLAAGNWGRNSEYELYQPFSARIFYDDSKRDGFEMIEAWRSGDKWSPVRNRTTMSGVLADLPRMFTTHQAYGNATVADILGERFSKMKYVEANRLESMIFLNRGSRFKAAPLPSEAQLSPVFSMNVGDLDGDGNEDLFLSQNFFGSASDIHRDDSGRGLWLRGKGDGTFAALDSTVSGVSIHGQQRGAALADFNHDGRVDLAVSQNNAATKLYLNERAKRGLRVTLRGPASNPYCIGTQMRLLFKGEKKGALRSVHDTTAQILGFTDDPESLWIRWPDGHEQAVPIQKEVWDVMVSFNDGPK